MGSEQHARKSIDQLLAAGWAVKDFKAADIHAARGVAIREFVLEAGQGFADYLLYVGGKAASVIEGKKVNFTDTACRFSPPATRWVRPRAHRTGAARCRSSMRTRTPGRTSPTARRQPRVRSVFGFHQPPLHSRPSICADRCAEHEAHEDDF